MAMILKNNLPSLNTLNKLNKKRRKKPLLYTNAILKG